MTTPLAARLAEVLRCNCSPTAIEGGGFIHDWACRHELRPAVLAFIEAELAREREEQHAATVNRVIRIMAITDARNFNYPKAMDRIRALSAKGT